MSTGIALFQTVMHMSNLESSAQQQCGKGSSWPSHNTYSLTSGSVVGLKLAKSERSTQSQPVSRTFSVLMSPWQIFLLWHSSRTFRSWNTIHFFSIVLRKGRVLERGREREREWMAHAIQSHITYTWVYHRGWILCAASQGKLPYQSPTQCMDSVLIQCQQYWVYAHITCVCVYSGMISASNSITFWYIYSISS